MVVAVFLLFGLNDVHNLRTASKVSIPVDYADEAQALVVANGVDGAEPAGEVNDNILAD